MPVPKGYFESAIAQRDTQVSVSNAEGPPVPIPNTEVKLCSAENTCLATGRKNRSMPTYRKVTKIKYSSLAQSVERMTVNHDVAGSSPAGGAIIGGQFDNSSRKSLIFKDFFGF